jgi:hypothetical protein
MRTALAVALLLATLPALPAGAVDDYRHGRFRTVEGGVFVQGAEDTASDEATRHLPYLPGDRVWTDAGGRAEFQFVDGSQLRLDFGSKLDYLEHVEGADERVLLRLWSGSLFLRARERGTSWEIETSAGLVTVERPGAVRVDATAGAVRVSVYEGAAALESGRSRTDLGPGERAWADRGYAPSLAERFDRGEDDEFALWNADLDDRREYASEHYLPDELDVYAADFEDNGEWIYEVEVGYVWRPYVAASWQPYRDGRWVYTAYGWTWVPYESWGWAPFHYGRWGYSGRGWYWVPGRTWGPAWVSWSIGRDYVGWCALGHRDRVWASPHHRGSRGRAYPRGSFGGDPHDAWNYVRRGELGARDVARRRVDVARVAADPQRLIDQPVRLGRDFEPAAERPRLAGARPRGGGGGTVTTSRPTIGDHVPELRDDPATTIPTPRARRRGEIERRQSEAAQAETGRTEAARPRTPVPADEGRNWGARTRRESPSAPAAADPAVAAPRTESPRSRTLWREDSPARSRDRGDGSPAAPSYDRPARERTPAPADARPRGEGRTWWRQAPEADRPRPEGGTTAPRAAEPAPEARPRSGDDQVQRFLRSLSSPRARDRGENRDSGAAAAPRSRDEGRERAPRSYGESSRGQERSPRSFGERPQGQDRQRAPRVEPRREAPRPKPSGSGSSNSGSGRARHRDRDN